MKKRFVSLFIFVFLVASFFMLPNVQADTYKITFGEVIKNRIVGKRFNYWTADPDNSSNIDGTISVDYNDSDWLSVEPKRYSISPGEQLVLTITIDANHLDVGSFTGTANESNNSTVPYNTLKINVTVVDEDPIISVQPTTLDFGLKKKEDQPQKTFTIQNTGGGTLTGKVTPKEDWISVNSSSFSLNRDEKKTITVSLDLSSLSKGSNDGKIEIKSNDKTVYVNVTVNIQSAGPILSISDTSINLGRIRKGEDGEATVTISNTGDEKLKGRLTPEDQYVTADPDSFELEKSKKVTVTIKTANTGKLNPGDYSKDVKVTSDGGNKTINVLFEIFEDNPKLGFEPTLLDFGIMGQGESKTDTFSIENKGGGALNIDLSKTADWIQISPSSASVKKQEKVSFEVKVNTSSLKEGVYKDKISLKSNGGNGEIIILLQVKEVDPVLNVSEKLLKLPPKMRNERQETSVKIKNAGGKVLSGTIECSNKAVSFNPKTFSLKSGDEITVNISIDLTDLSLGNKFFSLEVKSNGGDQTIFIEFELKPKPPLLVVLPLDVDIGEIQTGNSTPFNVMISNKGEEILIATLSSQDEWIQIPEKQLQIKAGETYKATLTAVNKTSDKEGAIVGKVNIESNGGKYDLPVHAVFKKYEATVIILFIGKQTAFKNNVPILLDVPPQIYKGRTIVPLRFISESFGAEVSWEAETSTIRIYYPILNIYITLQINNTTARIDKKVVKLDIPPMIVQGRTLIPLRFISEAFGAQVDWDSIEQKITITIKII